MNEKTHTYRRSRVAIILFVLLLIVLFVANLVVGSVNIPIDEVMSILSGNGSSNEAWELIMLQSRVPMTVTAVLAGAALAVSGLLMQTTFNNPLAGPSILGVSTGASLGVAVVMLALGGEFGTLFGSTIGGYISILAGALAGAAVILSLLIIFSSLVRGTTMLLIVGIMISYLSSSVISLLNFFSTQEGVHSYVIWGLGNFSGVTTDSLPAFSIIIIAGMVWAMLMAKPLNALLLGTRYAENLGVNIRRTRNELLLITGILTAAATAFCGPIAFVGLVVPHIARLLLNSSNHNILLPATVLAGADIALLCQLISVLPASSIGIIPINAITPAIGVPVIIYIILNREKIQYFN